MEEKSEIGNRKPEAPEAGASRLVAQDATASKASLVQNEPVAMQLRTTCGSSRLETGSHAP